MNEKRREIIVREIEYWKRSRLLPEHYCDYLLALYTEGEVTPSVAPRRKRWATVFVMFLVCLLLPAGVLVIYFTELSFVLQMLLLAFFVGICLIGIWRWRREAVVHLPLISGAFLLFLAMVRMSDYYFPGSKMVLSLVVFFKLFPMGYCRDTLSFFIFNDLWSDWINVTSSIILFLTSRLRFSCLAEN